MPGNKTGGKLAATKIKQLYGNDFYVKIGKAGGAASRSGGFASPKVGKDGLTGRQRAVLAGQAGGKGQRLENFSILDEAPFDDGFNQPGAWARLKDRLF